MAVLDEKGLEYFWGKVKSALSGKQDKLTPDESIVLKDGNVGVALPTKAFTQEEYDALPEEQKKSGLCFVDDGKSSGGGSGGSSAGAAEDIYSTEETRIGTWIDGKPLYRICCNTIIPSSTDGPVAGWEELNVEKIIQVNGYLQVDSVSQYPINSSTYFRVTLRNGVPTIHLESGSGFYGKETWITMEYTKTTD